MGRHLDKAAVFFPPVGYGVICMHKGRDRDRIERGGFLLFLAAITAATLYIAWPFLPPLFWALLAAIMFQPLNRRMLLILRGRKNYAALASLLKIGRAHV